MANETTTAAAPNKALWSNSTKKVIEILAIAFWFYVLTKVFVFDSDVSKQRLQRGVFRSVVELQTAINRFIEETNQMPRPFVWTADPAKIIAAVRRGHQVLDSNH